MATGKIDSGAPLLVTVTTPSTVTFTGDAYKIGHLLIVAGNIKTTAQIDVYGIVLTLPYPSLTSTNFPLFNVYYGPASSAIYIDKNTSNIRVGGLNLSAGTYNIYCVVPV